jgi:hypothetical protein
MAGQVWRALDVITVNQTDGKKKRKNRESRGCLRRLKEDLSHTASSCTTFVLTKNKVWSGADGGEGEVNCSRLKAHDIQQQEELFTFA